MPTEVAKRPPMSDAAKAKLREKAQARMAAGIQPFGRTEPMAQATNEAPPRVTEEPVLVEMSQLEPATPTKEMRIAAELRQRSYVDEETLADEDGSIQVTTGPLGKRLGGLDQGMRMRAISHRRARRVRLYKPNGVAATIPADNYFQALDDGWTADCPQCHTDCGGSDWGCGKAPEPKFLRCEVCRRKFHDIPLVVLNDEGEEDPLQLQNPWAATDGKVASGASASYLAHMWAYHRDMALAMGLPVPEH